MASVIGFVGAIIAVVVTQFFALRQQRERLQHDRKIRLIDDRRLLYRDFLEISYSLINTLNRAANLAYLDEIAVEKQFKVTDEAREEALGRAGSLTDEAVAKLDFLQARFREIEIIGGERPAIAAYEVYLAVERLWASFPTDIKKPISRGEYGELHAHAQRKIQVFSEQISQQLIMD